MNEKEEKDLENEIKNEERKGPAIYRHLVLKIILSLLAVLILQAASIVIGYALKENTAGLIASLVCIHAAEIVALAYFILNLWLAGKKDDRFKILIHVTWILLFLLAILIALEVYMVG